MNENDLREFLVTFQDHLAPKLDVYEQAIYLYIFRNSRLIGRDEAVIALKSERNRMAVGIGMDGSPMSESTESKKSNRCKRKGAWISYERLTPDDCSRCAFRLKFLVASQYQLVTHLLT